MVFVPCSTTLANSEATPEKNKGLGFPAKRRESLSPIPDPPTCPLRERSKSKGRKNHPQPRRLGTSESLAKRGVSPRLSVEVVEILKLGTEPTGPRLGKERQRHRASATTRNENRPRENQRCANHRPIVRTEGEPHPQRTLRRLR